MLFRSNNGTGLASNYTIAGAGNTGQITPASVTLAGTRVYDATTAFAAAAFGAAGTINTGVGVETLILSGSGSVPSANAGAAQVLALNTLALNNGTGLASNYTIAGAGNTGQITPAALTAVSLVGAVTKTYNGNNTVSNLTTGNYSIAGFVGGEGATITNQNVASSITAAQVTATLTNSGVTKVYDGTTISLATPTYSVVGAVGTDTVNVATGTLNYNTSNVVGSSFLTAGGLTVGSVTGSTFASPSLATDYALTATTTSSAAASASITPASVTLAGTRAYDATTAFAAATFGAAGTINTGVGGETLIVSGSGSVPSPNVGTQTLTVGTLTLNNGTGLASNYTIAGAGNTGTITPVTPPPPPSPQTPVNNLDGLINPILVGLQSLGIGVPPVEELLGCMIGDLGTPVDDGVAVSLPYRCVPAIPD